ncbi:hypothetical protein CIB95_12585 [Lottiidibacillus patelloidae]|uniref:GGDEF domain-containing protein n=1 Tax=Lottiidibacillus patelloidae TaxID=2670334 RepID=A0A263BRE0_9BACI|nr:hypothetical protein [Lottiidibacillus patelloidae]OZM56254.1 hypothetical protein CIB95_12585 [Lottiidibacillus patelloidae]
MLLNYLLLLDTDKIKEYVFASSKLKEIRGASMLLETLNVEKTKKVILDYFGFSENKLEENDKFRIIYLDGGSGKVEFAEEEDAKNCGELIEGLYRKWTNSASISWEVVELNHDAYYESVSKGEFKLRQKKQAGRSYGQNKHLGIIYRCSHSGYEMVEDIQQEFYEVNKVEQKYKTLSKRNETEVPFAKISPSSVIKQAFYDEYKEVSSPIRENLAEIYNDSFEWPKQLSVIGKAAGNNEIGLLYFDGNSMNKLLKKIKTSEGYREFSKHLKNCIRKSVIDTIIKLYPTTDSFPLLVNNDEGTDDSDKVNVLPIELILTAGDDLIVAVPSNKAMEFASSFLRKFAIYSKETFKYQREIDPNWRGLTMSAGVAIAKASFPIKYLVPLAEQLLRSAKKKNYELKLDGVTDAEELSTLDYTVVSMSSNPDLNSIRSQQLRRSTKDGEYLLTKRPYTLTQWQQLQNVIESMKEHKLPSSKIKAFYHLHFLEEWEANYYYGKYIGNLSDDLREDFKELYKILYEGQSAESLWVNENDYDSSPLIDAFEIYRYLEGGNRQWQTS